FPPQKDIAWKAIRTSLFKRPHRLKSYVCECHQVPSGAFAILPYPGREPTMPSFDITSDVNKVELKNAVDQSNKEIQNRFDFKGSDARIEQSELTLTLYAVDEFKLGQVT